MKNIKQLQKKWQNDPAFRKAYDDLEGEFSIACALIEARSKADLTQGQVAERMRTSQSAVARLESGAGNPSIDLLKRYATATGTHLKVELQP